jgi:hypothetical protein
MKQFATIMLVLLCAFSGNAQDKILLMNGQERNCKIVSDTGLVVTYEYAKRNGKIKLLTANRGEIFSYTKQGNPEVIVYEMDTLFANNIYEASQMRAFLAGQNDARSNFKARHIAAIGFVSCALIGFVGQDGYFTAVGPPILFTLSQFIGKVKIREKTMSNVAYKYNDIYADGYEPPARTKKLITALWSGFAGSAMGVTLYFITR